MILWRISNHADLNGLGGVHRSGRWHFAGVPVVYLSESPALALLEVMVNFDLAPDELPADCQLLEVDCSAVGVLSLNDDQPGEQWEDSRPLTQSIGSEWLASGASALLKVPSAVVPKSWNYLLSPRHATPLTQPSDHRVATRSTQGWSSHRLPDQSNASLALP